MPLFEPIELTWQNRKFVITPSRALRAIAKVEDIITLQQLSKADQVPFAKLALAYHALLKFAGANVTEEEVYEALWGATGEGQSAVAMVNALLSMMLPPKVRKALEDQNAEELKRLEEEAKKGKGPEEGKDKAPTNVAS